MQSNFFKKKELNMYLHVLNLVCACRDKTTYVCLYVHHFDMLVELCVVVFFRKQYSDYKQAIWVHVLAPP